MASKEKEGLCDPLRILIIFCGLFQVINAVEGKLTRDYPGYDMD